MTPSGLVAALALVAPDVQADAAKEFVDVLSHLILKRRRQVLQVTLSSLLLVAITTDDHREPAPQETVLL
ncbi:hypothetical protein [Mesorhizobium sp.]|uniref:hypothetical protein n=1 Tax=Mesorhizobium sp. TaxID=1871066 RepID=UPI000FE42E13|nr:hypothetical protein [Mesorhizobium sp.]RWJ03421.1 MAG: hypothetical protein EOR24_32080 [Mesorhizobium sp.]